eukprot:1183001-Prorocentrum_minimum.AAC.2
MRDIHESSIHTVTFATLISPSIWRGTAFPSRGRGATSRCARQPYAVKPSRETLHRAWPVWTRQVTTAPRRWTRPTWRAGRRRPWTIVATTATPTLTRMLPSAGARALFIRIDIIE